MRGKKKSQSGQATLEMALTLTLVLGFVFFQLQVALVLAYGNYAQYATFMAARAYLAGGVSEEDSRTRAMSVLSQMLKQGEGAQQDRWPSIAKTVGGEEGAQIGKASNADEAGPEASSWMVGVRYTFQSRLFFFSLGMGNEGSGSRDARSLTLSSESWLGSEPTYSSCSSDLQEKEAPLIDNGC